MQDDLLKITIKHTPLKPKLNKNSSYMLYMDTKKF